VSVGDGFGFKRDCGEGTWCEGLVLLVLLRSPSFFFPGFQSIGNPFSPHFSSSSKWVFNERRSWKMEMDVEMEDGDGRGDGQMEDFGRLEKEK